MYVLLQSAMLFHPSLHPPRPASTSALVQSAWDIVILTAKVPGYFSSALHILLPQTSKHLVNYLKRCLDV